MKVLARRRSAALILLVAALVGAGALGLASAGQDRQAQQLRNSGQAAFEEKQYNAAAEAFAVVGRGSDATAQDLFNLALTRYELSDDAAALEALAAAETRDPELAAVYYLRGLIHRRGSAPELARTDFERAEVLVPHDPAVLYNLAATLEALDEPELARQRFQRVIEMGFDVGFQHYVSSLYRVGFQYMRGGDRAAARPYLEKYQQYQRRLSQAQRAPAASEAGRLKRVVVPVANLVAASPDSFSEARFEPPAELGRATEATTLWDLGGPATVLVPGVDGHIYAGEIRAPLSVPAGTMALGDYDRDGLEDLLVAADGHLSLYRNSGGPPQVDAAAMAAVGSTGLPEVSQVTSLLWVDADHDGDLDILVTSATAGDAMHLIDNHGDATFVETTTDAGMDTTAPAAGAVWADFDADSDVDLYVVRPQAPNALYSNARGGRFVEIAAAVGAGGGRGDRAAVAEDLDNDGDIDLAIAGDSGLSLIANTGDGTFEPAEMLSGDRLQQVFAADLNNDGYLDLLVGGANGIRVLINAGELGFNTLDPGFGDATVVGVGDANADGAIDVLLSADGALQWRRQAGPVASWLTVRLSGVKNNRRGIGARVEVKAGGSYQLRPMRNGVVHVGLGGAEAAEVVRVTWPNGIVQNEMDVPADQALGPVAEVERLEGSCPLLYTWNGTEWQFINEVLGVAPLGMPLAAGVIHPADYDEYVPVPGSALRAVDGAFELRLTEELRETGYLDAVRLLAVDRPANMRVLPDERFVAPPHPDFRLFLATDPQLPRARDDAGVDVSSVLESADGSWTRPPALGPYEGLAVPHALELELPGASGASTVRLYLTGWVYWATGSANLVVDEDPRYAFEPVRLEVPDGHGGWRVAIEDIGLPNGKNSTLSVDLTGVLDPRDPRIRISTTLRLYWDAAFYTVDDSHPEGIRPLGSWAGAWGVPNAGTMRFNGAADAGAPLPRVHVLAPHSAEIRWRGFSQLQRGADGFETFRYGVVSMLAPWNQHRGRYTRYGSIGELLQVADDRFAIVGTGDEVAVRFLDTLPPPPRGWQRDWLVYLNGWVKDGDPNTLYGDRVEPLPFHAMSTYPYPLAESYPDDPVHRGYELTYNTRSARANQPSLRR